MVRDEHPVSCLTVIPAQARRPVLRALDSVMQQTVLPDRIVVSTIPGGPAMARNHGSIGDEDWVAYLDDDDQWKPEYLGRMLAHEGDVVICSNEDGSGIGAKSYSRDDMVRILESGASVVTGSCLVVRREYLKAAGGFREDLTHSEVWEFLWRALCRGADVVSVPEKLVYRNHHQGQLSRTRPFSDIMAERIQITKENPCLPLPD